MLFLIGHYAFIFAVDTFISSYLIWLYCNKLVLRYVRLRVSDPGQVSIPQPGIVTVNNNTVVKIWTPSTFGPLEHREIEI